jgi:hypothetical protein
VHEYRDLGKPHHPKYIQLKDPFILFHYHVIDPSHGNPVACWSDFVADQGRYNQWRGSAFEVVCLYPIKQLKNALGIGGVLTKEYPWSSERQACGAQVDLVIERADRVVDLCEMKFTDGPFMLNAQNEQDLIHKREVFRDETKTRFALKTVLVSVSGTRGNRDGAVSNMLDVDDLFYRW